MSSLKSKNRDVHASSAKIKHLYRGSNPPRVSQGVFFTEALAEFQHINCMIAQICEVKRVACYARC